MMKNEKTVGELLKGLIKSVKIVQENWQGFYRSSCSICSRSIYEVSPHGCLKSDSDENMVHDSDLVCSKGARSQDTTKRKVCMLYTKEARKDIIWESWVWAPPGATFFTCLL